MHKRGWCFSENNWVAPPETTLAELLPTGNGSRCHRFCLHAVFALGRGATSAQDAVVNKPRFLVIRGGAIGDFIMTLPAIGALRERWPEAHIEILGYPHIIELAHQRYYADAIRSIEARAMAGFFVPGGPLDRDLVAYFGSFHVVVSYLYDPDEIFAANVRRCGVRQYLACSPRVTNRPAAEHYCQPLESLAVYVTDPCPRVFPSDADRAAADRILGEWRDERLAMIHPGSGSPRKNWPVGKFAAVARWVTEQLGCRVLVLEGEADHEVARQLATYVTDLPVQWVRGLRLVEVAAVMQRCRLYIGNDSGPTHLAAASGAPTVAIFGPVSSAVWRPRGAHVRVVAMQEGDEELVRQAARELTTATPAPG